MRLYASSLHSNAACLIVDCYRHVHIDGLEFLRFFVPFQTVSFLLDLLLGSVPDLLPISLPPCFGIVPSHAVLVFCCMPDSKPQSFYSQCTYTLSSAALLCTTSCFSGHPICARRNMNAAHIPPAHRARLLHSRVTPPHAYQLLAGSVFTTLMPTAR
jgi:hypothetical protein